MFLGKRGEAQEILFKYVFEGLLLAAVTLAIYLYVSSAVADDAIYKEYYARDNALLLDTLMGVPGDAIIVYPLDTRTVGNLDFIFQNNRVIVKTSEETELLTYFLYGDDINIENFETEFVIQENIVHKLTKQGNKITAEGLLDE